MLTPEKLFLVERRDQLRTYLEINPGGITKYLLELDLMIKKENDLVSQLPLVSPLKASLQMSTIGEP